GWNRRWYGPPHDVYGGGWNGPWYGPPHDIYGGGWNGPWYGPPHDIYGGGWYRPGYGPPRAIYRARAHLRPFDSDGYAAVPVFSPVFGGWGFWFFGVWIPLF